MADIKQTNLESATQANHNLLRGISENGGIVFYGVDSTAIVAEMERLHKTSAVTTAALGRLLTAAAMMGGMLKSRQDTITLQLRGGGPAGRLLAVADGNGNVRGYVENPVLELPLRENGHLNVGAAVGKDGTLDVIRDMGLREPYVGQVPLVSGEIAEDITSYFATSEQTPTVCALGVLVNPDLSVQCAGGFIVQLLPGATEEEISLLEKNIQGMQSVTTLLSEGKSVQDMLGMALAGFAPDILDSETVAYHCNCSKERVQAVLRSLGRPEVEKLRDEDPLAEVNCQFCNHTYKIDLNSLLENWQNPKAEE
ncbi:MAG: Hsp33 family molecular chaperone HslO [Gemmiger sp.]|nr:Hsp33 family molecular chaperone HslO [Gemmiger sp.]